MFNHAYQSEDLPQAFTAMNLPNDVDPNFYADNGATSHMTSDPGILHPVSPYHSTAKVYISDCTSIPITHASSVYPLDILN